MRMHGAAYGLPLLRVLHWIQRQYCTDRRELQESRHQPDFHCCIQQCKNYLSQQCFGGHHRVKQLEKFAGRDPLQEMIDAGHAAGLKVHAWFEYGFASSYSANGGPIVNARPDWAALDQAGKLVVKNGFDWLNAFNPEVQDFMINLVKEVVTKYDIDGVQGDDRLPALPSTAGYDPFTVAQYKLENNNQSPPTDFKDQAWVKWRANRLNKFMKRFYTEIKAAKPSVIVSSSPSPYPWSLAEYLQDWPTWVDSSWVDAVIPQCYRYDITAYDAVMSEQVGYHRSKKFLSMLESWSKSEANWQLQNS